MFQEFAEVCQSLSQTGSRLQMADIVGEFLARLDIDEAEIAARFMVGRSLAQGEEKRLQISGRAIWKIVAAMAGAEDQGEDIYNSAEDFGDAIGMLLKLRSSEPEPRLTIREVAAKFAEIADVEGRNSRVPRDVDLYNIVAVLPGQNGGSGPAMEILLGNGAVSNLIREAKTFQGAGYEGFLKSLKTGFRTVIVRKPEASRDRSSEVYVLAKRPQPAARTGR